MEPPVSEDLLIKCSDVKGNWRLLIGQNVSDLRHAVASLFCATFFHLVILLSSETFTDPSIYPISSKTQQLDSSPSLLKEIAYGCRPLQAMRQHIWPSCGCEPKVVNSQMWPKYPKTNWGHFWPTWDALGKMKSGCKPWAAHVVNGEYGPNIVKHIGATFCSFAWHAVLLWLTCGPHLANRSGAPKCHHSMQAGGPDVGCGIWAKTIMLCGAARFSDLASRNVIIDFKMLLLTFKTRSKLAQKYI